MTPQIDLLASEIKDHKRSVTAISKTLMNVTDEI